MRIFQNFDCYKPIFYKIFSWGANFVLNLIVNIHIHISLYITANITAMPTLCVAFDIFTNFTMKNSMEEILTRKCHGSPKKSAKICNLKKSPSVRRLSALLAPVYLFKFTNSGQKFSHAPSALVLFIFLTW